MTVVHYFVNIVAVFAVAANALPEGAPAEACAEIFPVGHSAITNEASDPMDSPVVLDLSAFRTENGTSYYYPGWEYAITLSHENSEEDADDHEEFRGLLVQARLTADGTTPVGGFSSFSSNTKMSSCSQPQTAVTHSNREEKECELLTWTAPANGTGPLQFLYAVVEHYHPDEGENTFYATLRSPVIMEDDRAPEESDVNCNEDGDSAASSNALSLWTATLLLVSSIHFL